MSRRATAPSDASTKATVTTPSVHSAYPVPMDLSTDYTAYSFSMPLGACVRAVPGGANIYLNIPHSLLRLQKSFVTSVFAFADAVLTTRNPFDTPPDYMIGFTGPRILAALGLVPPSVFKGEPYDVILHVAGESQIAADTRKEFFATVTKHHADNRLVAGVARVLSVSTFQAIGFSEIVVDLGNGLVDGMDAAAPIVRLILINPEAQGLLHLPPHLSPEQVIGRARSEIYGLCVMWTNRSAPTESCIRIDKIHKFAGDLIAMKRCSPLSNSLLLGAADVVYNHVASDKPFAGPLCGLVSCMYHIFSEASRGLSTYGIGPFLANERCSSRVSHDAMIAPASDGHPPKTSVALRWLTSHQIVFVCGHTNCLACFLLKMSRGVFACNVCFMHLRLKSHENMVSLGPGNLQDSADRMICAPGAETPGIATPTSYIPAYTVYRVDNPAVQILRPTWKPPVTALTADEFADICASILDAETLKTPCDGECSHLDSFSLCSTFSLPGDPDADAQYSTHGVPGATSLDLYTEM